MDKLVCGIDIGSTNVKVLLCNEKAQTLWRQSIPLPRVRQDDQPVTDAAALVAMLERMILEGWKTLGAPSPLQAIAIAGVGEDGVAVDRHLRPLDFAIPWFDRRARQEAAWLRSRLAGDIRGGMAIDFSRTAAKWRWLRNQRPHALEGAHKWIALTDYPAVWWSRTPFISETLAARTGCYDVFQRRWMHDHLDLAGAPDLPPVLAAGTVVGQVRAGALIEGGAACGQTRLISGGHDHPIAASAVRRFDPHALVDSLGTANLMYDEVASAEIRADPFIAFSVPPLRASGVSCLGVFEFSASLEAFRREQAGSRLKDFLAAQSAPDEPGGVKTIAGAMTRLLTQRGTGVSSLRTVLEASCFYARRMLDSIRAAGSAGSSRLYDVGGWARSRALVQLRASVFGQAVTTVDEQELTALGAALIALDGCAGNASHAIPLRPTRTVPPQPQWQAHYERIYPQVREHLDLLVQDLAT